MLTTSQIAAIIMLLQAFGVSPSIIAEVQNDITPTEQTTSANTQAATTQKTVGTTTDATDSPVYTTVSVSNYSADPNFYQDQSVLMTGLTDKFLPATNALGSTNYISIENPFDPSQPEVMVQVANQNLYAAAVNALQNPSSPILGFVNVYGSGTSDQEFTRTSLFGSSNVMEPTINAIRIDQCLHDSMNDTIVNSDFNSNFTCTDWQTIGN
jgi:hypothetical protein